MLPLARIAPVPFVAVTLLTSQPSQAEDVCAPTSLPLAHRLEASPSLPAGTVRPVVKLASLQPSGTPLLVVLEGVVMPASAREPTRTSYTNAMADLEGTPVRFIASADAPDRHGRLHGSVGFEDGGSLGERILAVGGGLADVSFAPCATRFLAAEAKARAEKRGFWGQSRIWTDLNAAAKGLPDFVLGRGKVASIGRSGRTTYINFGGNFRTDATVRLREAMTSALVAAGRTPESLSGKVIEVRGWANRRNGLDMELGSPLALRLLDEASGMGTD